MFSHFFGSYLISKGIITKQQLHEILHCQTTQRVKLGLIAVANNLLTEEKASEINQIQASQDKRFGDIAIEKGYLTKNQVDYLLEQQGSPYIAFVHAAVQTGILDLGQIHHLLFQYRKDLNLTSHDLNALKNGDINMIAKRFIQIDKPLFLEHFSLLLRNIIRFISTEIYFCHSHSTYSYSFDNLASQRLIGEYEIFVGISGNQNDLLEIAESFAGMEFPSLDADALDAVCEFINCVNGLFIRKLYDSSIEEDLLPPVCYPKGTLDSDGALVYILPVSIDGKTVDLVLTESPSLIFSEYERPKQEAGGILECQQYLS